MNTSSLRFRITSWYLGLLLASLAVFGASVFVAIENYLDESLEHSLRDQAHNISTKFLSEVHRRGESFVIGEINESYAPESSGQFIRVLRADGSILYQSENSQDPFIDANSIPFPGKQQASSYQTLPLKDTQLVLYSETTRIPDGTEFTLQTGATRRGTDLILHRLLTTLLMVTPFVLLCAAFGGYFLMKQPLKPVADLTEQAERIGNHGIGERLSVIRSGDELERLSLALNRMIERLEEALAHIHRFCADVSHELRTPLTILTGELEHVIQRPRLDLDSKDAVGSALEEIERMSSIIDDLLIISRLDSGGVVMKREPVDLTALCLSTIEQMRLIAEEKRIDLKCVSGQPVQVSGDASRLKQVVVNLLDNAIKYTPDGGTVSVSVRQQPLGVAMTVDDTGIGIAADAIPHIFERFFRADKARNRDSGGTGLGLSIVKSICAAHEGTVSVESQEGRGTSVTVFLPWILPESNGAKDVPRNEQKEGQVVGR
jgi:two-component system OmpR family sensor kinase